ncbi:CUL1 [Cordylochernes scorpioides]|uniref:CUL1 n=1 Tax=Cordylochernes scorpioides TaxID=51811 RepID=A0ABY6KLG0_9ARAC|nr:CUL1 [Cordylochernes scorpioides]
MNIANEMLDSVRDDLNLLQRVITGDEAQLLSKRLVLDQSLGVEVESKYLSKLSEVLKKDFSISKRLIEEFNSSLSMNKDFAQFVLESDESLSLTYEIRLLNSLIWPIENTKDNCLLPGDVGKCESLFQTFFLIQNENRNMTVNHKLMRKLQETTEISLETLLEVLEILVKLTVLKSDKAEDLGLDSTVALNLAYTSSKLKINLNIPKKSLKNKAEKRDGFLDSRCEKSTMDAAIVRIMKKKRELLHKELLEQVTAEIRSWQRFDLKMFKDSISNLIEREFLERSGNNQELYIYIP